MEVSVRELKNHLSEYLRHVQAGEDVIVTSRGKVIARLSGATAAHSRTASGAEAIQALEGLPWVSRPRKRGQLKGSDRPTPVPAGTTEDIMRRIRGE